jgi:hypothetical protein
VSTSSTVNAIDPVGVSSFVVCGVCGPSPLDGRGVASSRDGDGDRVGVGQGAAGADVPRSLVAIWSEPPW